MMTEYDVSFYETADGRRPAEEFIASLDKKMIAKTLKDIDLLKAVGPALREPHSKPLGDGIFELRTQVASNISRVLYFFVVGHKIILTHGFVKKTRKTPPSEIETAKTYRKDYHARMEDAHE